MSSDPFPSQGQSSSFPHGAHQNLRFCPWQPPPPSDQLTADSLSERQHPFRHYDHTNRNFTHVPAAHEVDLEQGIERFMGTTASSTEATPRSHSSDFGHIPVPGSNIGTAANPAASTSSSGPNYESYTSILQQPFTDNHAAHAYPSATATDVVPPVITVTGPDGTTPDLMMSFGGTPQGRGVSQPNPPHFQRQNSPSVDQGGPFVQHPSISSSISHGEPEAFPSYQSSGPQSAPSSLPSRHSTTFPASQGVPRSYHGGGQWLDTNRMDVAGANGSQPSPFEQDAWHSATPRAHQQVYEEGQLGQFEDDAVAGMDQDEAAGTQWEEDNIMDEGVGGEMDEGADVEGEMDGETDVEGEMDEETDAEGETYDEPETQEAGDGAPRANPFAQGGFSLLDILGGDLNHMLQSLSTYMAEVGSSYSSDRITQAEYHRLQEETLHRALKQILKALLAAVLCAGTRLSVDEASAICADYIDSFDLLVMFAIIAHVDIQQLVGEHEAKEGQFSWKWLFQPTDVSRIEVRVVRAVLIEVADWWQNIILALYKFVKEEVLTQATLFPDVALLKRLWQPLLMALHRHASSGSYLHLFRLKANVRLASFSPMFTQHMDSAAAWQVAVGIAHRLTTSYEYDLLRHGGLLMVIIAIINFLCEDPDSRIAMVRYLFEKNPMCNAMPPSEAGQQWSSIFGPAAAILSVALAGIERDGFDVTPATLLSMEDMFKTKQDCTVEFISKTCKEGSTKEQYDMGWINLFARYHTAEALHPAQRDRSVSSDLSVTFNPADPAFIVPNYTSGAMQSSSFLYNYQKMSPGDALARFGPQLVASYNAGIQIGRAHRSATRTSLPVKHYENLIRSTASGTAAIADEAYTALVRSNTKMAIQGKEEWKRKQEAGRPIRVRRTQRHVKSVARQTDLAFHYAVPLTVQPDGVETTPASVPTSTAAFVQGSSNTA